MIYVLEGFLKLVLQKIQKKNKTINYKYYSNKALNHNLRMLSLPYFRFLHSFNMKLVIADYKKIWC